MRILSLATAFVALACLSACGDGTTTPAAGKDTSTADGQVGDTADALGDGSGVDTVSPDGTATDGTGDAIADTSTDAGSDTATVKHQTCVQLADCVAAACQVPSADCHKACFAEASADAQTKAAVLLACVQGQCQQGKCKGSTDPKCMDDCLGQKCMTETIGCIDLAKTGTETCAQGLGCVDKCSMATGGAFACLQGCWNGMTGPAHGQLDALGKCLAGAKGPDPMKECSTPFYACALGGQTGPKACWEVFGCSDKCKEGDDGCNLQCLAQATSDGQKQFIDMASCLGVEPLTPECAGKFATCAQPSGTKSCIDTIGCIQGCSGPDGGDPGASCLFQCLHDATKEAAPNVFAFAACFGNADPAKASTCADAGVKCIAPSGTDTCPQILTCAMGCAKPGENPQPACIFGCAAKGSTQAAKDFMLWSTCRQACEPKCPKDDQTCIDGCMAKDCPEPKKACAAPTT